MTGAAAHMDRRVLGASTAVPEDPALPSLTEALDPAAMLGLLRRDLATADGYGIEGCTVDRVRYRPGARAVVQYTVRLVGPSGREREQWVTALLYPRDRARQVWGKLQASMPAIGVSGAVLPPAVLVSDASLILQVFPVDRRLPSLPALLNPGQIAAVLPQLQGSAAWAWMAEPVRYRAGIGCAIRWQVVAHSSGEGRAYVKAYRGRQGARTHIAILGLRSASGAHGFAIPEPVVYLQDHRALVQKEVTGRCLAEVLLSDDDPTSVMRRVAEALATFHRVAPAPERHRATSDVLDDVRRAATVVSWVRPTLAEAVQSLVSHVADGLHDVEPAATHGDLKPDHVLVSEDGLALVDFDWFSSGDPVADAGSMVARLTGIALRHPAAAGQIDAAGRAFADAYFDRVPATWRRRFTPHHVGALLQEAAGCFRHQLPKWPELMDATVQRATDALSP